MNNKVTFKGGEWKNSNFEDVEFIAARFYNCIIKNCTLIDCDFFEDCEVEGCTIIYSTTEKQHKGFCDWLRGMFKGKVRL